MSFELKPYSKNQSLNLPEDNTMTVKEYKEAVKALKSRNKYNARSAIYKGVTYHSKLEAAYAQELDYRKTLAEIKDWEPQVRLDLKVKGKLLRSYWIDFKVIYFDRPPDYVEVKGAKTDYWQMKFDLLKIVREEVLEPGAKIILQFKSNRKVY